MTVTKIHTSTTIGANRRPHSGDVFFADGAAYGWFFVPAMHGKPEELLFSSYRHRASGAWEHFTFRSPKRAAALLAKLEG